jgi:hypothetical protein
MTKIVLVSSLHPTATAVYFAKALREAFSSVLVISDISHPMADVVVRECFELPKVLRQKSFEPDLLLFIEGGTMRLLPMGLEKLECITAWYAIDTHTDYKKHLYLSRLFDLTFVAQKEYLHKLMEDGVSKAHWLPLACEPSIYPSETLPRLWDIAYVGSSDSLAHPVRLQLLDALSKVFPKIWRGKATVQEMGKIYSQARLVFNKSLNNDVNMRFFEAMGSGAVLLTDPVTNNGIDELFRKNEHYFEYRDQDDLLELANKLLADPVYLEQLGAISKAWVLQHHTYAQRAQKGIEIMLTAVKSVTRPTLDDYLLVMKALRLDAAFLRHLGSSYRASKGSVRQKCSAKLIALDCYLLGLIVRGLEWLGIRRP